MSTITKRSSTITRISTMIIISMPMMDRCQSRIRMSIDTNRSATSTRTIPTCITGMGIRGAHAEQRRYGVC